MTRRAKRLIGRVAFIVLLIFLLGWTLFPFYWAIVSSMKTGTDLFGSALLPPHPTLGNYASALDGPFLLAIGNSVVVAGSVVLISLVVSVSAAFALGRVPFRGRGTLLMVILAASMFPQVAVLSGVFELVRGLGLYNTRSGLILADLILTLPFTIWTLTIFMRALPARAGGGGGDRRRAAVGNPGQGFPPAAHTRIGDDRTSGLHRRVERVPVRADADARSRANRPGRHLANLRHQSA